MKDKNPCWKGYEMIGTKKKGGKSVPNCVPKEQYDVRDTINLISELFGAVFASKFGSRLQVDDSSVTWNDINNSLVENNVSTETIAKVATFFSQLDEEVEEMEEGYVKKMNKKAKNLRLTMKGRAKLGATDSSKSWQQNRAAALKAGRGMQEEAELDEASYDSLGLRSLHSTDPKKQPFYKTQKGREKAAKKNVPDLKSAIKSTLGKHPKPNLPEEIEQMDENYRVLAQKGIGAERKGDIKVGHGVDYYHPKDGSKHMGKIHHMDDKGYTVKDDETGAKHKFDYYRKESFEPVEERNTFKNLKRILQGKDITSRVSQELTKAGDAAEKDPKKAKKHYRRYDKLVAVGEATKKKVVVKTNEPVGYRIADIGPGGKEYNVKTDKAWDKKMKKEQVHESRVLAKHGNVEVHRLDDETISVRKNGKQIAAGEFDRGSDLFFITHKSLGKGQRGFDTSSQIAKHFHGIKETAGVGWMLRADPKLAAKVKANVDKKKQMDSLMKKYGGKTGDEIAKMKKEEAEQMDERNDTWHPDPAKDRMIGGRGSAILARQSPTKSVGSKNHHLELLKKLAASGKKIAAPLPERTERSADVKPEKYVDSKGKTKIRMVPSKVNVVEKAPPGAKYERMVKHIKKGYAKGGLTDQEKSIAYATAWKAKNRGK
jgi:hypothetical protein